MCCWPRRTLKLKLVAYTRHRDNVLRAPRIILQLSAEIAYEDMELLCFVTVLRPPHPTQKHPVGKDLVGVKNQLL